MNPEKIGQVVSESVQKQMGAAYKTIMHMATAMLQLEDRIKLLEASGPDRGEDGQQGPKGEQGPQGDKVDPGKDADPIDIADIARELATLPEINTVLDLLATEAVIKHFEENPVVHGKDGRDGIDGKNGCDGERGIPGIPGEKGDPGRDGLDVKDMFRNHEGHLIAVMSDGTTRDLGEFIGKDGRDGIDGKDGADGLGFDDMMPSYAPGKGLTLSYARGEQKKEITIPIVAMEHVGFWREGMAAKTLNTVTHNGCLWIAKRETSATPCAENPDDWALAARKGRDGDRGLPGKDYTPPKPIKLSGE